MQLDERILLDILRRRTTEDPKAPYVKQLISDLKMDKKRAVEIFRKWERNGWYDYGVSILSGRLTKKGLSV